MARGFGVDMAGCLHFDDAIGLARPVSQSELASVLSSHPERSGFTAGPGSNLAVNWRVAVQERVREFGTVFSANGNNRDGWL